MNKENLWQFGISGDFPIICETIKDIDEIDRILNAKKFLEFKNFKFDLILIADESAGYHQPILSVLKGIASENIHVFSKSSLNDETLSLFEEVAF